MENIVEEATIAYNQKFTVDEYLNMEWENGQRYEYWDGELVAMSYTAKAHNRIASNINRRFIEKKSKSGCESYQESIMLRLEKENIYFLPDIMLTCHPNDLNQQNFQVKYPSIIAEVLSPSTELYDRTQKWDQYRKIKSLRHYLLVSQHAYKVDMYSRANEHMLFFYQSFEGLEAVIPFPDLGFEISLQEVYEGIQLPVANEIEP